MYSGLFFDRRNRTTRGRVFLTVLVALAILPNCFGQATFLTGRSDNQRSAANANETLLTPQNVNANSFGQLFSQSLDYQALAQPLYVPNVSIPGKGTHNVVYVATMADTVYAFDADNNQGGNATPLWSVNFTNPGNGITLASYADGTLPCTNAKSTGPGFNQEGIASTPVVDTSTGTLYVVAKTVENGKVTHRLHALDMTTGQEKFGGPALISATFTSNAGKKVTFNSLHQKNRPGLLLLNGTLYLGFGSNYCNDSNQSWLLSYDASSLKQTGVFNANPDHGYSSIWQSGQGITADTNVPPNIYVTTSEGKFDGNLPNGQGYPNSVLKLSANPLALADFFTPSNIDYLDTHDLDLSSSGPIIALDQNGQPMVVAAAKQGTIYVMDPNNLGGYTAGGPDHILQELTFAVGPMFDSPAYWNGMVYFAGNADVIKGFSVGAGQLSTLPIVTTAQKYVGSHSPSISANGNTNGILWVMSGNRLYAFDATSLQPLYSTAPKVLPTLAHFATQSVVNGKVYIATETTLEVYGLFSALNVVSGNNQSAPAFTQLANPIKIQATDPYTGSGLAGVTVSFSDGGKGGTFNPGSAVTDSSGLVSTSYKVPQKAGNYTITASAPGLASVVLTETAVPGAAAKLAVKAGNKQTAPAGTVLPLALTSKLQDQYGNGISGVSVSMDDGNKGGVFTPSCSISSPCTTDGGGLVRVQYQLPTAAGTYTIKATGGGFTAKFIEYATAGSAANISPTGGNNQTAPAGTQLPQSLTALVVDLYGNPVSGVGVTFDDGGAGGSFGSNPVNTDKSGTASQTYTLPSAPGTFSINATVAGVNAPATFTEIAQ